MSTGDDTPLPRSELLLYRGGGVRARIEGELAPERTVRKFRIVQAEGGREVRRLAFALAKRRPAPRKPKDTDA